MRKSAPRNAKLNLEGLAPDKAIKKLIESSFDHLAAHPRLHRAAQRRETGAAPGMCVARNGSRPCIRRWSAWSRRSWRRVLRTGMFRTGINPVHLYISIAGLSYFFLFQHAPRCRRSSARIFTGAAAKRARRAHVVDLVMHSLRP